MSTTEETEASGAAGTYGAKELKAAASAMAEEFRDIPERAWEGERSHVTSSAEPEEAIVEAAREISRGFVFSVLAVVGAGLMTVVLITHVDWFYPAAFFGFVTYVAWQRYF
jgi:hypothetical protein